MHRLPYLLGDLQAGLDQSLGNRVRLVQQRRNPPGSRLSTHLRRPGAMAGRLDAGSPRPVAVARRWPARQARADLRQPQAAQHRRLLRAVDLRLRKPHHRSTGEAHAGGTAAQPDQRPADESQVVGQLGRRPRRLTADRSRGPGAEKGWHAGAARTRAGLHVLPAADLRALPEPVVCQSDDAR